MSSKKKSHGVLFTPYLEKGEDLIWVGVPVKNPYLHFQATFYSKRIYQYFCAVLFPTAFALFFDRYYHWSTFAPALLTAAAFFFTGLILGYFVLFARPGKVFYAITNKRLLILRRHFWNSLDTDLLMLLPEHSLQSEPDKTGSIRFPPLRIDEHHRRGRILWESYDEVVYEEIHRAHLENLNQEDAETASELLTAVKNDMLDQRARELGLMD